MTVEKKERSEGWKMQSVVKAFGLLKLFTGKNPEWTFNQLLQEKKFPKSTLSNMLRTLEFCGVLEKEKTSQLYRLGLDVLEMSYSVRKALPIIEYAMKFLDDVQQKTGGIVYFTIPKDGRVLYLDASYPANKNVTYSITGKTLDMHCTGVGKAMMSKMSDEQIRGIVAEHGMKRYTPRTITDFDALMEEIEETRARGYALDFGEESQGVKCVAVPVASGRMLLGAISISGSIIGLKEEQYEEYAEMLFEIANILADKADMFPRQFLCGV